MKINTARKLKIEERRTAVAHLMAQGLTQKQISETLHVSEATVNTDAKVIQQRLDAAHASPKRADLERRLGDVLANLKGGLTQRKLAEALGVSLGTINSDVKTIFERLKLEQVTTADETRLLMIARIDTLLNGLWEQAIKGDFKAIEAIDRLEERRAKLTGAYAPEVWEISGRGGKPIEYQDVEALRQKRWMAVTERLARLEAERKAAQEK